MVDGDVQSPQMPDPIQQVERILQQIQDVSLIRKYALWLAKKHPDKAVHVRECLCVFLSPGTKRDSQILTGRGLATKVKFDDRALLSELRAINQEAANMYLEYTVVKKRSAVGLPPSSSRGIRLNCDSSGQDPA